MRLIKIALYLLIITAFPVLSHSKPLIAITEITYDSARASLLTTLITKHYANILTTIDSFELIDSASLQKLLKDYNCIEDSCVVRFARKADIDIVIRGSIKDSGDYLDLRLYAIGYNVPHNGKNVADYSVKIDLSSSKLSSQELDMMMEEHTGRFLAQLHNNYKEAVFIKKDGSLTKKMNTGTYALYKIINEEDGLTAFTESGEIQISSSQKILETLPSGKYFIVKQYKKDAAFLKDFYYGRKKEYVFPQPSIEETLFTVLATPLIGVISPLASPFAYHMTSDYEGLGLWAVNNTPYLYIASKGFFDRPDELKKQKKDISRFDNASSLYTFYYFFGAGMSMYADAAGHYSVTEASAYNTPPPYMGNEYTAIYLSVLGNGGGHFYKGHRYWGYLYFHLDNILALTSLYYLSDSQSRTEGRYQTQKQDISPAYFTIAAALAVRAIETLHCSQMKFNIENGSKKPSSFTLSPLIEVDENSELIAGLSVDKRL